MNGSTTIKYFVSINRKQNINILKLSKQRIVFYCFDKETCTFAISYSFYLQQKTPCLLTNIYF
jgi:hypothetical protein